MTSRREAVNEAKMILAEAIVGGIDQYAEIVRHSRAAVCLDDRRAVQVDARVTWQDYGDVVNEPVTFEITIRELTA